MVDEDVGWWNLWRPRARTMTVPETAATAVANTTVLVLEFVFNMDEAMRKKWLVFAQWKATTFTLFINGIKCIIKHFSWLRVHLFGRCIKKGWLFGTWKRRVDLWVWPTFGTKKRSGSFLNFYIFVQLVIDDVFVGPLSRPTHPHHQIIWPEKITA